MRDRRGFRKHRPVIILTATEDIVGDDAFEVMAITTTFADPPPPGHIELPWHPLGNVSTQLRCRSAAVLNWLAELRPADILRLHGDVPPRIMLEILESLESA